MSPSFLPLPQISSQQRQYGPSPQTYSSLVQLPTHALSLLPHGPYFQFCKQNKIYRPLCKLSTIHNIISPLSFPFGPQLTQSNLLNSHKSFLLLGFIKSSPACFFSSTTICNCLLIIYKPPSFALCVLGKLSPPEPHPQPYLSFFIPFLVSVRM